MFTYLINAKEWENSIKALRFARKLHDGQIRKSGEPYISHPLTMACHALSLGIDDDRIISGILLHDVVEDCGVKSSDIPCSDEVKEIVKLLTYVKPRDLTKVDIYKEIYYENISFNPQASIIKLLDRCHNVSTMGGVFSKEKLKDYIKETKTYILPLYRHTKESYPEFGSQLFIIKYQIISILETIEGIENSNCLLMSKE